MRALVVAMALAAAPCAAERGLTTLSVQSGQVVTLAPTPVAQRDAPVLATLDYGLAERLSLASVAGLELGPTRWTLSVSLGPRLTFFRGEWWTAQALLQPELLWTPVAGRVDLGLRAGLAARWLVIWGVGLSFEAGVRGRAAMTGPLAPALQGYFVAGPYIEA